MSKPHISLRHYRNGASKWYCTSTEGGLFGPYERVGSGYTPLDAFRKWWVGTEAVRLQALGVKIRRGTIRCPF